MPQTIIGGHYEIYKTGSLGYFGSVDSFVRCWRMANRCFDRHDSIMTEHAQPIKELTEAERQRADDIYQEKLNSMSSEGGFYCWQQLNEIGMQALKEIGRAIRDGDEPEIGRLIVREVTAILRSEAEHQAREKS